MGKVIIQHMDDARLRGEPTVGSDGRKYGSRIVGDEQEGPWIYINHLEPHRTVPPHSHTQDETIFIVEGELDLGNRVIGPGTVLYVEGGTEYGFTAGKDGVRFLNVRPGSAEFQMNGTTRDPRKEMGLKSD